VLRGSADAELFGELLRGMHRGRHEQDFHSVAGLPFGDLPLLARDLFAAEALVGHGDVGVGVVALVVDPFGFAGAALRALAALERVVGEGFLPVQGRPGAVADATEQAVGDAPLVAEGEFGT
jgi:hypothetical protein